MTVVNPKSISGINSITTGSGSDNLLTIHTSDANNTERFRIDSTGVTKIVTGIVTTLTATGSAKVGTGITLSPDGDVFATGVTTSTTFVGNLTGDVTGTASQVTIASGANNRVLTAASANTIQGETNINIDGGILIIGHTATTTTSNGESPFVQVKSTDSRGGASFIRHSANASGSGLYIGKSRNATIGSNTIVQDDDELGRITFSGDDGTDINSEGAKIVASVDGTPGSNDMPGRLQFYTTADGAASPTERLRIYSGGQIGIRNTNATSFNGGGDDLVIGNATDGQDAGITLYSHSSDNGSIFFNDTADTGITGLIQYRHDVDCLRVFTATSERLRIDSSGNFLVGGTSLGAADSFGVQPSGHFRHISASGSTGDTLIGAVDGVSNGFQVNISGTNVQKYKFHNGSTQTVQIDSDGLKFMNDTAAANALHDYEEGTFTPTCVSGGFNNWSTNVGRYTKIGRLVNVSWEEAFSGTGDGSDLKIGGLPFVADDWTPGSMYAQNFTAEANSEVTPAVRSGEAIISVVTWGAEATGNQFSGYSAWNITYTTAS